MSAMASQTPTSLPISSDLPRYETRPSVSRVGTVAAGVASIITQVDQIWNSSSIQNAIQVLEQLSDLGKALPIIAPAFVMLSLIIQVEQKARDADAKCSDLLDRITFMVQNLEVLRRVKVTNSAQRVIERMNDAIKDSAALIQAYRKQNLLARRLHIGNRDKFVACAGTVRTCTDDLMMTLQIQQTSQLDVLTRAVPVDSADEVAQGFVSQNGGLERIKADPALITQLAKELKLKVDDDAIQQINTSLSDLMQENQVRLEQMLKANVGTAVVRGIQDLVAQMNEAEKEDQFTCVQCEATFRISTNGPRSCNFHRAAYDSWHKHYPCCGSKNPCQWGSHRSSHHCEYPYGSFFDYAYKITGYIDTVKKWTEVEDQSLVDNQIQSAFVGRLLRLVSKGHLLQEPTILIVVGRIWHGGAYFFDTFTVEDLHRVNSFVRMTGNIMIFRSAYEDSDYSMAEWDLSESGDIVGVRLTARAATSPTPFVTVCPLDIAKCTTTGEPHILSKGGLRAFKPQAPYVLPETVRVGPELQDKPIRATRTDFKTRTSPSLPVKLKVTSDPPLKANPKFASYEHDNFVGSITVFNNSPVTSSPVTIASASALFRMVGNEDYLPVKYLQFTGRVTLPVTIDPMRSCLLDFEIAVPRSDEDAKRQVRWHDRAFVARQRPVRVKLVFKDIEDEESSLVVEHVFHPLFPLDKKKDKDLEYFYFDDLQAWERRGVRVDGPNSTGKHVISFNGHGLDPIDLKKAVYQAMTTGQGEVDLKNLPNPQNTLWWWKVWALVDLSCLRVYAFKVLLQQGGVDDRPTAACLGYVLCPEYGDVHDETRPIRYATETISMPAVQESVGEVFITDDTFDDPVPDQPIPPTGTTTTPSSETGQIILSEELNSRLTSIDASLARIATSLELLVGRFSK